ncbi:MAG: rhodanese-like domain-containing protein [Clostridia bacterium]|nr:rhodanese-like domain-containing protein [Clostridia bacterium]
MKKLLRILLLVISVAVTLTTVGCGGNVQEESEMIYEKNSDGYYQITPEDARNIMGGESDYVILDVRTQDEYNELHIPDAVLLPDTEICNRASEVLPDKDKLILVYCRSGRRSKNASAELAALGYTNVYEFGGIIDWPYETE